jgi:hypothetical protein
MPMTPPALAGAGAMDHVPMLRAAAIQRRECSEIFLTLSMFAFELKSDDVTTHTVKYAGSSSPATPDPFNDAGMEVL